MIPNLRRCESVTVAFLLVLFEMMTKPVNSSVIWRCPEFSLMTCKEPPPDCQSLSMIYLRHGDIECPACLVCADPRHHEPWPEEVRRAGELRRKRERRRMRLYSKRKRKGNRKTVKEIKPKNDDMYQRISLTNQ